MGWSSVAAGEGGVELVESSLSLGLDVAGGAGEDLFWGVPVQVSTAREN